MTKKRAGSKRVGSTKKAADRKKRAAKRKPALRERETEYSPKDSDEPLELGGPMLGGHRKKK